MLNKHKMAENWKILRTFACFLARNVIFKVIYFYLFN